MKKKIISIFAIAAVGAAIAFTIQASKQTPNLSLLSANIEALSQNEEGTAVKTCYVGNISGTREYALECHASTSESTIYPCPSSHTWVAKTGSNKCTE